MAVVTSIDDVRWTVGYDSGFDGLLRQDSEGMMIPQCCFHSVSRCLLLVFATWTFAIFQGEKESRCWAQEQPIPGKTAPPDARQESVKPGINKDFLSRELDVDEYVKRFEVESREVYSQRAKLTELLELKPGMGIADIGAGTGAYLNLFAEGVGEGGKVYAVDIAPNFLKHLAERVREAKWKHVEVVACDERQTGLGEGVIDRAYICDTYHHFEFPMQTMTSLFKAMRPGGMLVVVDFEREPGRSREWILNHVRAGKKEVQAEIEGVGFTYVDEPRVEGLTENYVLRFRR